MTLENAPHLWQSMQICALAKAQRALCLGGLHVGARHPELRRSCWGAFGRRPLGRRAAAEARPGPAGPACLLADDAHAVLAMNLQWERLRTSGWILSSRSLSRPEIGDRGRSSSFLSGSFPEVWTTHNREPYREVLKSKLFSDSFSQRQIDACPKLSQLLTLWLWNATVIDIADNVPAQKWGKGLGQGIEVKLWPHARKEAL